MRQQCIGFVFFEDGHNICCRIQWKHTGTTFCRVQLFTHCEYRLFGFLTQRQKFFFNQIFSFEIQLKSFQCGDFFTK